MKNEQLIDELVNNILALKTLVLQKLGGENQEKPATTLQFSALNFLKSNSKVTVGELARFLKLSKSSATQLSNRLVKTGLLERVSDKNDRRIIHLNLTKKGERECLLLKKQSLEKLKLVFSKVPAKDIKELLKVQNKIIETLSK